MAKTIALISTIQPVDGGVPSMTRWVCRLLEEVEITPILAWYAPWRNYPQLSVPSYKIISRKPGYVNKTGLLRYDGVGIGAWFPELEFTHYLPTRKWKELIFSCDLHLSVSGNPLCATPYMLLKIPFMAWIATPWDADRVNRVNQFGLSRRFLDNIINKPVLSMIEKKILSSGFGQIIPLSNYTSKEFQKISGRTIDQVMLMPINTRLFYPEPARTRPWRIGFSGRYCDPRKNIRLLLHATRLIQVWGYDVEIILVGERNYHHLVPVIQEFHVEGKVKCYGHMEPNELASMLQTFDLFIIPSFQEGLCISALEAMACGVPIISTRCGGPEDYVLPNRTGELVESNPTMVATAVIDLCLDRERRNTLSRNCSEWIQNNASENRSRSIFRSQLTQLQSRSKPTGQLHRVPL